MADKKHPFIPYRRERFDEATMHRRADEFYELMDSRRSVRYFTDDPVPRELIEKAILTASTAPSALKSKTLDPVTLELKS